MHVLFKSVLVHVCVPRLLFAILRLLEVERRFIIRNYEIKSTLCLPSVKGSIPSPSATLCGDRLYVIGGDTNGYSCSLQELLLRCQPIPQPLNSISPKSTWRALPTLPQKDSTAATLCEELIVIGGGDEESSLDCIHQLAGQKWVDVIGIMATGRRRCLVANESPEKIFIVGGILEARHNSPSIRAHGLSAAEEISARLVMCGTSSLLTRQICAK